MKKELAGRTFFKKYCTSKGIGKVKMGPRKGQSWEADEGHEIRIKNLTKQIEKCVVHLQNFVRSRSTENSSSH